MGTTLMRLRHATSFKRFFSLFNNLSHREKALVISTIFIGIFVLLAGPLTALSEYVEDNQRLISARKEQLSKITAQSHRYAELAERLKALKASFNESQVSFEQVTSELDRIVKKSIGSNKYSLKKTHSPESLGLDFEKQDFTLNIASLTLEQLVNLLYELDQGSNVLFLGKVDVIKGRQKGTMRTTIVIASISKRRN